MTLPQIPESVLGDDIVRSPEAQPAPFTHSRKSTASQRSLDEVTLNGGDSDTIKSPPLSPQGMHRRSPTLTRFRSATVAVDRSEMSYKQYKKGKMRKDKGVFCWEYT